MMRFNSCVIGFGLATLALSGCAAVPTAGVEPTAASSAGSESDLGDASSSPEEIEISAIPNQKFAQAVGPVLDSFPNDTAFFYFDSEKQPVIGFTDKAVPAVMEAVASTGQQAQIIEDTGFTQAEYTAAADEVIADLKETWPQNVPFPIVGERPDLGVGVIGAVRVTADASANAAQSNEESSQSSLEESTRLIEKAGTEPPFSIQIDDERVFGEGHTSSKG
jgi:hypothetical protein